MLFTPKIINITDYRQEGCADITFRMAGVQTLRRAEAEGLTVERADN